jgi:Protein of unknown function (DUF4038)/Putative collagen-binding domain of a collagenase
MQSFRVLQREGEIASGTVQRAVRNAPGQLMTLDPTGKFLINSITGKPVFITGEDGWSMQVQLSDADTIVYLDDRASRGFNAIWIGLVDNTYSNHPPFDDYGNAPFNGPDFTNENPTYWARVDQNLSWAAAKGITILADPAFVGYGCSMGYCQSYRKSSKDVLTAYGQFLGNRYKGFPNVIWVIGGDADPTDKNVQSKLNALASGIRSADTVHLITTESYRGYSSEQVWGGAPWLDLDALYEQPANIPARANADYKAGTYPVFMFEDWYEGDHSMTELAVRQEGYWAVLSGGTLGRLFGNYAIWDFSWSGVTKDPWKAQLAAPGSKGQAWLGKLFRSREHWKLVPDIAHHVMTAGYGSGNKLSVAARTSDGQTIIAYIPNGNATTVTIDMSKITDAGSRAKCWWFSPSAGSTRVIGSFATAGNQGFTPPDANDWVLVIDSHSAKLPAPGTKDL